MLDNTSFQHLAFLLPQQKTLPLSSEGVLDTLHLIEALLLADSISVPSYPGSTSYEEGERLAAALNDLVSRDGAPLLRMRITDLGTVGDMATTTVEDAFGHGLKPREELWATTSASGGLPRTGKDITHLFWSKAAKRKMKEKDLVESAQRFLAENGADGALAYGIVHSDAVREHVLKLIRETGVPEPEYWHRLLVLFRAHDNDALANSMGLRYTPGHVRQSVLVKNLSWSLDRLWSAIKPHVNDIRREIGLAPDALVNREEAGYRFPFLGLVVLRRLRAPGEDRLEDICRLRDDPGICELRDLTAKLDQSFASHDGNLLKPLLEEHGQLRTAVVNQLRMPSQRNLPLKLPNGLGQASLVTYLLERLSEFVPWTGTWRYRRLPGTKVLLRCATLAAGEPSIERAMRQYLGPLSTTRL
jgi:hypothetical protein